MPLMMMMMMFDVRRLMEYGIWMLMAFFRFTNIQHKIKYSFLCCQLNTLTANSKVADDTWGIL